MNIIALLSQTWHITWRNWQLWLLNLALFIVAIPAFTFGGALGGLGAMLALPTAGFQPDWVRQLRQIPGWAWLFISFGALVFIVITSALAWLLQAAAMRGAALAAEHGSFSLGQALNLGRQRVFSILQLSLTLGFLLALIVLAPFPLLFIARNSGFGLPLMNIAEVGLAPFSTVLSIALLLVMMSVALENLRPRAAFRQAWRVFSRSWWAFLLILGLSFIPGVALAIITVPAVMIGIVAFIAAPSFAPVVAVALCGCLGPLALVIVLFTAVFTVVLYTLVYREASRQLSPLLR